MKIRCRTNLDLYPYEQWPDELPCRPMVGDIITSSTGLELEVVRVTFAKKEIAYRCNDNFFMKERTKLEMVACTELHLVKGRFENVVKFREWYRNR